MVSGQLIAVSAAVLLSQSPSPLFRNINFGGFTRYLSLANGTVRGCMSDFQCRAWLLIAITVHYDNVVRRCSDSLGPHVHCALPLRFLTFRNTGCH
mmetsp:Transcript_38075/g.82477  ORF Transcript_38075/g.82477 Transcript_38075/m.82477 type:complete len:96 (+) Transcript_38075:436-723(+)